MAVWEDEDAVKIPFTSVKWQNSRKGKDFVT